MHDLALLRPKAVPSHSIRFDRIMNGEVVRRMFNIGQTVIQTQTPINPGNAGGPLLSDDGLLVGVNAFGTKETQGLNFAISANRAAAQAGKPSG
jgi:S1-C subfamily serine protease